jgi:hypothetical protein
MVGVVCQGKQKAAKKEGLGFLSRMGKKGIPAGKPDYSRQSRLNTTHFVACAFSTGSLDRFHPSWQLLDSILKNGKRKAAESGIRRVSNFTTWL